MSYAVVVMNPKKKKKAKEKQYRPGQWLPGIWYTGSDGKQYQTAPERKRKPLWASSMHEAMIMEMQGKSRTEAQFRALQRKKRKKRNPAYLDDYSAAGIGSAATPIEYATVRFPVLDDKGKRYLKRLSGLLRGPPGTTVRVPSARAIRPIGPGEAVVQIGVEPATTEQINESFLQPPPVRARRPRQMSFFDAVPELGLEFARRKPPQSMPAIYTLKKVKKNPRSKMARAKRRRRRPNPGGMWDGVVRRGGAPGQLELPLGGRGRGEISVRGMPGRGARWWEQTSASTSAMSHGSPTKAQRKAAAAARRKARYRRLHPRDEDYYMPGGPPGKRDRAAAMRAARVSLGMTPYPKRRKPKAKPRKTKKRAAASAALTKRTSKATWRRLRRDARGRFLKAGSKKGRKKGKSRTSRRFYGTARHRSISYQTRARRAAYARRKKGGRRLRATMDIRAGQVIAGRAILRNPRTGELYMSRAIVANPRRRRRRNGRRSVTVANRRRRRRNPGRITVRNPIGSFITVGKQAAIPMGAGAVGGAITGYLDARVLKDKHTVSVLSKAGIGILGALLLRKKPLIAMGFAGGCFGSLGYAFGLKMGGGLVAHSAASAALGLADMADSDPQVAAMLAGLADVVPDGMGDATGDYSDALGDVVQDY